LTDNGPTIIPRPAGAWPKASLGFKVELFATGLRNPRLMRAAPNGDVFLAESHIGTIVVFRGIGADGKPRQTEEYVSKLRDPFGMAFMVRSCFPTTAASACGEFATRESDLRSCNR
jgi:glucose/arabinose dehydrogenase